MYYLLCPYVKTQTQADLLSDQNCILHQGFHMITFLHIYTSYTLPTIYAILNISTIPYQLRAERDPLSTTLNLAKYCCAVTTALQCSSTYTSPLDQNIG